MDKDIHIKKFFEDMYKNPDMYNDYIRGMLTLDYNLYNKWYSEMKKNNELFSRSIREMNRPSNNDIIFESALSEGLSISESMLCESKIEVVEFKLPKVEELSLEQDSHHYLCNGCYETTLENIYKVLNNGSFTVGICCEKKTEQFKTIAKYYNGLKDFLMRRGYIASSFEENVSSKNRIYLLMYDSKNKHKK